MASAAKHCEVAQRLGIPTTRAGEPLSNGPEAQDALAFNLDHPMGRV